MCIYRLYNCAAATSYGMSKQDFKKINDYLWEIPKSFRSDMRVPGRLYVNDKLRTELEPDAITQIVNVATLPGIVKYSFAMPDAHTGYGFVIGGVAAMDVEQGGVISPGGVGFDIACGMRLLISGLTTEELEPYLDAVASEIQKEVPSGLGRGRKLKFETAAMNKILEFGAKGLMEEGYGEAEDIQNSEASGQHPNADPALVSDHAKTRGKDQIGTLGSGNHFSEIQRVDKIFDKEAAKAMGLFPNQVVIMIHTGSRGLGHQIATDYLRLMDQSVRKYNIRLPDRQLAATPFNSPEGQKYFQAMACGSNFALANRQMITYFVRKAWKSILGDRGGNLTMVYDIAHNTAKLEEYKVDGKNKKLIVHRKGATRAFPPGHAEIPKRYQSVGQPVFIPGSMGTASYVLVGREGGSEAWYSTCHGAGRTMSRHAAIRAFPGKEVVGSLEAKGIVVKSRSLRGIAEEAPGAYKDIDEVVDVVDKAGLSKKVARLVPLAVIKG